MLNVRPQNFTELQIIALDCMCIDVTHTNCEFLPCFAAVAIIFSEANDLFDLIVQSYFDKHSH